MLLRFASAECRKSRQDSPAKRTAGQSALLRTVDRVAEEHISLSTDKPPPPNPTFRGNGFVGAGTPCPVSEAYRLQPPFDSRPKIVPILLAMFYWPLPASCGKQKLRVKRTGLIPRGSSWPGTTRPLIFHPAPLEAQIASSELPLQGQPEYPGYRLQRFRSRESQCPVSISLCRLIRPRAW